MKITQTDTQIELKSSGLGQLVVGIILVIVGIVMTFVLLSSPGDNGKKAPIWLALVGAGIVIGGIVMALFAKNRSVTIQKGGDTTITAKKVIGGAPQAQTIPTASIVAVRLSTYIDRSGQNNTGGNQSNSRRSTLSLVLNNNDLIEVGNSASSGGFSINGLNVSGLINKAPLSKEAGQTATFLGVPLQGDDTSSIAGAVQSVRSAFQHGTPEPVQPATFNPNPQAPPPPAPPSPPVSPPSRIPPASPQIPPAENPGNPAPPPPYTPQPPAPPQQ